MSAKERDSHLAAQEVGEAQLAKLQMERLRLTGQILDRRIEQRGERWQSLATPFQMLDLPHLRELRAV